MLAVAWEKQSESNAMWALSIPVPFTVPVGAGAGGYFAPHVRSYIRGNGAPEHVGAMVAVKDRLNGSINPYAHLKQPDITVDTVLEGQMLWDPIRYDETCPSSDGACAVVIGDVHIGAESSVWFGCVIRGETYHFEVVANESARALMTLTLEGLAIGNGILTVENEAQALERALVKDKGGDAAAAALAMAALHARLRG